MVLTFTIEDNKISSSLNCEVDLDQVVVGDGSLCLPYDRNDGCRVIYKFYQSNGVALTNWKLPYIKHLEISARDLEAPAVYSVHGIAEHNLLEADPFGLESFRMLKWFRISSPIEDSRH